MISFAAITDIGLRDKNDDRVMINGRIISAGSVDGVADKELLATVCDGVGGYAHGDEAAEIASRVFASLAGKACSKDTFDTAVANANASVVAAQMIDADHRNMSTTVAGIYIKGRDIIVFNVGDSKAFRFRNSYLTQLSVDHTVAAESISLGLVRSIDDIDAGNRHKITRCIGDQSRCQPSISVGENRVFTGDVFLICSDGLSDVLGNDAIEAILNEPEDLSARCAELLAAALNSDSQDNISIVLLEVS